MYGPMGLYAHVFLHSLPCFFEIVLGLLGCIWRGPKYIIPPLLGEVCPQSWRVKFKNYSGLNLELHVNQDLHMNQGCVIACNSFHVRCDDVDVLIVLTLAIHKGVQDTLAYAGLQNL